MAIEQILCLQHDQLIPLEQTEEQPLMLLTRRQTLQVRFDVHNALECTEFYLLQEEDMLREAIDQSFSSQVSEEIDAAPIKIN